MKLPKELKEFLPPDFFGPIYSYYGKLMRDSAEAIVRDCAKVADEHEFTHGVKDYTAEPVSASILARYGLEPKS